ncbi:MAG: CPBP family intramembrane metalloprotease [Anaerolineales bacterium]|nr:CPBP family intramembrane metalloprotease [Anaerolineales bacterium]
MTIFLFGTLLLLAFLAWGTWRTAQALRDFTPDFNLLLLPAENILRVGLIGVCLGLAYFSGQSFAQFGWQSLDVSRDLLAGFFVGIVIALSVPQLTQWAIARFGASVYSPIVVKSILPRNQREWLLVPLALIPAVLLEELLFRSLLLGGFGAFAPPLLLALVWSILFGAMHLPQGALGIIVAAALGLLLSFLFLATQSVIAPLIAHYIINLLQLVWASRAKAWLDNYNSEKGET